MKKLLLMVCSFFVIPTQAMEDNDEKVRCEALAEAKYATLDESGLWKGLPLDLMKSIQPDPNENKTVYTMGGSQLWHIPYALRNIDPVNLTNEDQTGVDLTPHSIQSILLDTQFWPGERAGTASRLCSGSMRTNDHFSLHTVDIGKGSQLFDGINNNRLAISAKTGVGTGNIQGHNVHCFYVLRQSKDFAGVVMHSGSLYPALFEKGLLKSILLHREINRCVRSIENVDTNSTVPHCITIGDIIKVTHADCNGRVNTIVPVRIAYDGTMLSREDKCVTVASLATDFVLSKAIYVGKDTYLGLTEEGNMIVFWLNSENKIECNVRQNCHGKQFKDIAVDETVKTDSGFMPRVALLATNGDVFLTDLRMGGEKKILLYSCTLENPDNIFRFFYDKGQCAVVYKKEFAYDTFHVWPDNFNVLLAYLSLKSSQQKVSEEEK